MPSKKSSSVETDVVINGNEVENEPIVMDSDVREDVREDVVVNNPPKKPNPIKSEKEQGRKEEAAPKDIVILDGKFKVRMLQSEQVFFGGTIYNFKLGQIVRCPEELKNTFVIRGIGQVL